MPAEDRAVLRQPPPALPDGSMPTYTGHPLPVRPGGAPRSTGLGWGPVFDDDLPYADDHAEQPRSSRTMLLLALLFICGATAVGLITVLAVQA